MPISYSSGGASILAGGLIKTEYRGVKIAQQPPQILNIPENQISTINTIARGQGTLSYQWYLNGNILNGETSNTVSTNYGAGEYYVKVSNLYSVVESNRTTVNIGYNNASAAPLIITQPVNKTISKGGTALFTIVATGLGLTYVWQKNGDIVGTNSSTLTVTSTAPNYYADDGSVYTCTVSNGNGSVVSNPAKLYFIGEAPVVTLSPSNKNLLEGTSTNLTINATGYPEPLIEWFFPNNSGNYTGNSVSFNANTSIYNAGKNYVNWRVSNVYGAISGTVEITINSLIAPTVVYNFPQEINVNVTSDNPLSSDIFGEIAAYPPVIVSLKNEVNSVVASQESNRYNLIVPTYSRSLLGIPEIADSSMSLSYTPIEQTIPLVYSFYYYYDYSWNYSSDIPVPSPPAPVKINTTVRMPVIKSQPPQRIIIEPFSYWDDNGNLIVNPGLTSNPIEDARLLVEIYNHPFLNDIPPEDRWIAYVWYRNGIEYSREELPFYATSSYIDVNYNPENNNDVYYCVITNARGSVATQTTRITMDGLKVPVIKSIFPENATLNDSNVDGKCITFLIGISFKGTYNYVINLKVYRDNNFLYFYQIPAGRDTELNPVFLDVGPCNCSLDKNYYNITAIAVFDYVKTASPAQKSTKVYLDISPNIITQPISQTIDILVDPNPVVFEVEVCRGGMYIYQWYKQNVSYADTLIVGANTKTLSFIPSMDDNDTSYYCKISLPDGTKEVTSDIATLTILSYN